MRRVLSILLLATSACTTGGKFAVKTALVKPWSIETSQRRPVDEPYVARFEKGQSSLIYVAANHQYGTDSQLFVKIAEAISVYKPQIIITEGISDLNDEKRQRVENIAYQCSSDSFKKCGENIYGIYLAKKNGLMWTSAEPSDKLIREKLIEQHYSKNDIAFFYLARQIRQLRVEQNLNQDNFEQVANEILAAFAKFDDLPERLSLEMFLAWYQEKVHRPFVLSEIDSETTAPTIGPNMTYLNQISAAIGKIRDAHIIQVITDELNKYRRVLVIYGGSHFLTQHEALVDMLGKPTIIGN